MQKDLAGDHHIGSFNALHAHIVSFQLQPIQNSNLYSVTLKFETENCYLVRVRQNGENMFQRKCPYFKIYQSKMPSNIFMIVRYEWGSFGFHYRWSRKSKYWKLVVTSDANEIYISCSRKHTSFRINHVRAKDEEKKKKRSERKKNYEKVIQVGVTFFLNNSSFGVPLS